MTGASRTAQKELLARQRLCAYKIVTKGFVGKDECRISIEPPGFNVKCSVCWLVDVVLNMDLLNKQRLLFLFKKKSLEWIKKNSKPSQNE